MTMMRSRRKNKVGFQKDFTMFFINKEIRDGARWMHILIREDIQGIQDSEVSLQIPKMWYQSHLNESPVLAEQNN